MDNKNVSDSRIASEQESPYASVPLTEAARMVAALRSVAAATVGSPDLTPILNLATSRLADILSLDGTRVFVHDQGTGELNLKAYFERVPTIIPSHNSFKVGEGIVGMVTKLGKPLIFANVFTDPLYWQLKRSGGSRQAPRCFFAAFPIRGKAQNFAVLACIGVAPRQLSPGEINFLEALAAQLALAMENRELYAKLENEAQELRKTVAELDTAKRAKYELVSATSMEMRTHLTGILGHVEWLLDELVGAVNVEQEDALNAIASQASELLNAVDVLLLHPSEIDAP